MVQLLANIGNGLQMIELAKVRTMAEAARVQLRIHPGAKVVVCLNYVAGVAALREALGDLDPLVLTGDTSAKARAAAIEAFQRPTSERRLLIGNLSVCSTGIDLDDKDGRFPRLCLVSPNYSTITVHQVGHRFLRADSASDATVHMFYRHGQHELKVLDALARKSQVVKQVVSEQVEGGVVFPSDYEKVVVTRLDSLLAEKRYLDIDWSSPGLTEHPNPVARGAIRRVLGAARTIRAAMEEAYLNPAYAWGRRRLGREFERFRVEDAE